MEIITTPLNSEQTQLLKAISDKYNNNSVKQTCQ